MTESNSNSSKHNLPADGGSCMCCWDDLEASTYVEYLSSGESEWLPSGYCNGKSKEWMCNNFYFFLWVDMDESTRIYVYTNMYIYMHIFIFIFIHICIYINIYIYIYIYMYTYIHVFMYDT
jgi:hypothetical protein